MDFREVLSIKGKIDDVWKYDRELAVQPRGPDLLDRQPTSRHQAQQCPDVQSVGGVPTSTITINAGAACVPYNCSSPALLHRPMLN